MIEEIKRIAIDAVQQSYPAEIRVCPIVKLEPFTIQWSDRITLSSQLVISSRIKEMIVSTVPLGPEGVNIKFTDGTLNGTTSLGTCSIRLAGQTASYQVNPTLKAGDNVIVIRNAGGQKFFVIDKI